MLICEGYIGYVPIYLNSLSPIGVMDSAQDF